ncbi:MAG: zinc ABC transporter substrate-binding protein [Caldilineaceae bacterium]|nr:zinc ABC transporter substrate-binding protein [Caldilineaceae bacterium]
MLITACAPATSTANEPDTAGVADAAAHDDHAEAGDAGAGIDAHLTHAADLTPVTLGDGELLQVAATTNIIADVVAQVGGDAIALTALVPTGADPHSYQAKPDDLRLLDDAHVLFVNGLGLEEAMASILASLETTPLVSVNEDVTPRALEAAADDAAHDHGGIDPHTWMDVANVQLWVDTIEAALRALDPAHADTFAANAAAYRAELDALDAEIRAQIETIPPERRKLVTDHDSFGYFAAAYGVEVIGTVIPALSTLASPSARQLAALQDQLAQQDVAAVFVGTTVNPQVAERLAGDLGIRVVPVYTGSLSAADGPAASYVALMRYDVQALVDALGGE